MTVAAAGVEVATIERGKWARDGGPEFQDVVVLRKAGPPPSLRRGPDTRPAGIKRAPSSGASPTCGSSQSAGV